jgi:capsular polysaccharide biosynthesis protein
VEIIFTIKKTNLQDADKIENFIAKTFNNKIFNISKVYDLLDKDILSMHERGEI